VADEVTREAILKDLIARSTVFWGHARTEELGSALEQTATYLWEIGQADSETSVEPGFYQ
jgi:hypothetical protein